LRLGLEHLSNLFKAEFQTGTGLEKRVEQIAVYQDIVIGISSPGRTVYIEE